MHSPLGFIVQFWLDFGAHKLTSSFDTAMVLILYYVVENSLQMQIIAVIANGFTRNQPNTVDSKPSSALAE